MSGGGAKGYTYIGALKVIEKAGIRVDYIGGTSIGAIVGGIYASGMKAAEMDSLMRNTDIMGLIKESLPRHMRTFFEKQYGEKYAASFTMEGLSVNLPPAYSNGQHVFNKFSQWTTSVNHISDFSRLPIPFFCIGTDVATGEEVMMHEGFLPLAMRASGALPGLLAPVNYEGKLIADGGLVNNYPAKEVRDRGMDVVIGLSVETGLYQEKELESIEKIITQISTYQSNVRSREQVQYCDLIIRPEIDGYNLTSFDEAEALIRRGELAALSVWPDLVKIAERQKKAPEPSARPVPLKGDTLNLANFELPESFRMNKIMEGSFSQCSPGKISAANFYKGIEDLYATRQFKFIDFRLIDFGDGTVQACVNPILDKGANKQLRLGFHYDNIYKSSFLINITRQNTFFKNSSFSLDLILGDKFRYDLNYLVDRGGRWGIGFNARLRYNSLDFSLPQPIFIDSTLSVTNIQFDFIDISNEPYLHLLSSPVFATGLAFELKYFRNKAKLARNFQSDYAFSNEKSTSLIPSIFFKFDNRDSRYFTKRGGLVDFHARYLHWISNSEEQESENPDPGFNIDLHAEQAFQLSKRLSFGLTLDAGLTWGELTQSYLYIIGGNNQNFSNNFRPFIGLPHAGAVGSRLLMGSVYAQINPFKNHYLILSGSGAYLRNAFMSGNKNTSSFYSYGAGYGLNTILGPLAITYGRSNKGGEFYLNFGYWF